MPPERELATLLVEMKPTLDPREWVFCLVERDFDAIAHQPLLLFREPEGLTAIMERHDAEALEIDYSFPSRRITLRVHSDLYAVGFLAAVTAELAKHMIPTNVVSAFYHDHLFVPIEHAEDALRLLEGLSTQTAQRLL